jgi:hypothetical protein
MTDTNLNGEYADPTDKPASAESPLTPAHLIAIYCQPPTDERRADGYVGSLPEPDRPHASWHSGFVGYDGTTGFDDGHEYLDALIASRWRPMPELGDWPLVIYTWWAPCESNDRFALAHYCEGETLGSRSSTTGPRRALLYVISWDRQRLETARTDADRPRATWGDGSGELVKDHDS